MIVTSLVLSTTLLLLEQQQFAVAFQPIRYVPSSAANHLPSSPRILPPFNDADVPSGISTTTLANNLVLSSSRQQQQLLHTPRFRRDQRLYSSNYNLGDSSGGGGNNINNNNDDDDEEEGLNVMDGTSSSSGSSSNDNGNGNNSRKRDLIKNWMTPAEPRNMVRPILNSNDNDNGDSSPPEQQQQQPNVVRPNFDQLFTGMPSASDILATPPPEPPRSSSNARRTGNGNNATPGQRQQQVTTTTSPPKPPRFAKKSIVGGGGGGDEDWFEAERRKIIASYDEIRKEMLQSLQQEQQKSAAGGSSNDNDNNGDNNPLPPNAQAMMETVLQQEMELELAETYEALAQEQLQAYEAQRRQLIDNNDDNESSGEDNYSGSSTSYMDSVTNPEKVQGLMEASEAEYQRQEESRAEMDEFLRYEAEAFRQATARDSSNDDDDDANDGISSSSSATNNNKKKTIPPPPPGADLDQWALQQLQSMMEERVNAGTEASDVLDILEENIADLEKRLAKQQSTQASSSGAYTANPSNSDDSSSSSVVGVQPETMKEWQMYRAIAAQLAQNDALLGNTNNLLVKKEDTQERENRILAQLDAWKDYVVKEEEIRQESGLARGPKLPFDWQEPSSDEEAASLLSPQEQQQQQQDAIGRGNDSQADVRRRLNRMSVEAMEKLLLNSDPARREKLQKEIDYLKSVLQSNDYLDIDFPGDDPNGIGDNGEPVDIGDVLSPPAPTPSSSSAPTANAAVESSMQASTPPVRAPPPPVTPFFEEDTAAAVAAPKAAAPNTPFFNDGDNGSDTEQVEEPATFTEDSRLGSMEDQKLEAMFRRAGAKTVEEQAAIRKQYQQFQDLERSKRSATGLSSNADGDVEVDESLMNLSKYNVSQVEVNEDGDFDANQILSAIGPRPKRGDKYKSKQEPPKSKKDGDEPDVLSSMYRSVAAVGGGRYRDNPEEKAKQMASYADYVDSEEEMRQSLDDETPLDEELLNEINSVGGKQYADEAMALLGPRPSPKRARVVDEAALSDRNYDEDEDGSLKSALSAAAANASEEEGDGSDMPEWLRKENEGKGIGDRFLGGDATESYDETDYEENQRQLAEYERRRAGKEEGNPAGVDIGDALGLSRSNENADYQLDDQSRWTGRTSGGWGVASFAARKSNLLDYVELDVAEVNSVIDFKDSVHSTGVSQYMPRINKPFQEFGAIFRLEGLLVDVTGLQIQAWSKVAEKHGFKPPSEDDVGRASVIRAEVAVKEVFFWTDDFVESVNIAKTHREVFDEVFESWAKENGFSAAKEAVVGTGGLAMGEELFQEERPVQQKKSASFQPAVSEGQRVEDIYKAWERTAEVLDLKMPSENDIFTSMELSPDIAVMRVFRWSNVPVEVDVIVEVYESVLAGEDFADQGGEDDIRDEEDSSTTKGLDDNALMELHYMAWTKLAEAKGFEKPFPDEVVAAFVLNDSEIAVIDGFGWTEDEDAARKLAEEFHDLLDGYILEETGVSVNTGKRRTGAEEEEAEPVQQDGPLPSDIFKVYFEAWKETAETHGLYPPSESEVQIAMQMSPEEAIQRLLEWSDDKEEIAEGAETFDAALKAKADSMLGNGYGDKLLSRQSKSQSSQPAAPATSGQPTEEDILRTTMEAWADVALQKGYREPETDEVVFSFTVGPEMAVLLAFQWTDDEAEADALATLYRERLKVRQAQWQPAVHSEPEKEAAPKSLVSINPGIQQWVKSLLDVEMQCGIVSHLERHHVDILLQAAGLDELIVPDKRVSATNNYPRDTFQMLGAALRLERRPDHCVVFDSSPYAAVAAHDVEMQSVSFVGVYPRYELVSSDSTTTSFSDLTAMNIRRLFGERIYDQPLSESQGTEPIQRRKTKTKFFYDDDE